MSPKTTKHPQYGDLFSYETNEPLAESIEEIVEDAIDLVALLDAQARMDGVTITPNDSYRVRVLFTDEDLFNQAADYFEGKYAYEVVDHDFRMRDGLIDYSVGTYQSPSGMRLTFDYSRS